MPSISIYRPPAARRLEEQNANAQEREQIADSINGKHSCKCPAVIEDSGKKTPSSGIFKSAISSIRTQNQTLKCKNEVKKTESAGKARQRRPDMKVYVPKARRMLEEQLKLPKEEAAREIESVKDNNGLCEEMTISSGECEEKQKENGHENGMVNTLQSDQAHECPTQCAEEGIEEKKSSGCEIISVKPEIDVLNSEKCTTRTLQSITKSGTVSHLSPTSLWIEAQNEVNDTADSKKVSSQIISSNSADSNLPEDDSNLKLCDNKKEKQNLINLNPDECDWETLFDDNGECLDPSLIEQISSAVGAVSIEKPKSNYENVTTKSLDMVNNEFPHVIEIYNFPPEFRYQDLITVFSQFKNAGFEIMWVDDTHALGIFGNTQIVSEVLAFRHPFVKTRLLKDGSTSSKAKARRSAELLRPYKQRPDTCPALARRLVTGALGVRLATSREEREAERKLLSQAREKKRLEAKQREEAWEGMFN